MSGFVYSGVRILLKSQFVGFSAIVLVSTCWNELFHYHLSSRPLCDFLHNAVTISDRNRRLLVQTLDPYGFVLCFFFAELYSGDMSR